MQYVIYVYVYSTYKIIHRNIEIKIMRTDRKTEERHVG